MAFPLPDKPSIVVLPFTNMSNEKEQEYFADGLAEEIINALSKLSNVFVIARNSAFTYKGRQVKIQQVAEEMGVRYVLEGSVRKMGNKVRITAQLVDALTGNHLMSEQYERDVKDIFAIQRRCHHEGTYELACEFDRGRKRAHIRTRYEKPGGLPEDIAGI